ncbi:MAG: exosortase [Bacteroidales bacterium]|nr:exosortase [Bacteroidales bacterium]
MDTNRVKYCNTSFLLASLLIGSFVLAYFPVWKRLVLTWYGSDQYSHGFFIIPITFYIIWQKKDVLGKTPIRPSWWGLALIIFSLLIYIVAHFAEIMTIASFSMILLLAGVIIYFYGFLMLKELLFPLVFLLFMIPVPGQIYSSLTIPLQLFVSKVSVWLGSTIGIPIYREGNVIHLPDRTMQVVQACSGLRSMVSLLMLSAIFGYFTLKSNISRFALFFSGIPVAIFVNIIRVSLMVFAFYYFNYDLTQGSVHTVFGIIIFFISLIIIALTKGVLSIWDKSATEK